MLTLPDGLCSVEVYDFISPGRPRQAQAAEDPRLKPRPSQSQSQIMSHLSAPPSKPAAVEVAADDPGPRRRKPPSPPEEAARLEPMTDAKALAWVETENRRTLDVLEKDPRYPTLRAEALKLGRGVGPHPSPRFSNGRDLQLLAGRPARAGRLAAHHRRKLRHARPAMGDGDRPRPAVQGRRGQLGGKGVIYRQPAERRCLVHLSNGGEDAVTVREFDVVDKAFVPGGITLPTSKQDVAWLDDDTALVARDLSPGTIDRLGLSLRGQGGEARPAPGAGA